MYAATEAEAKRWTECIAHVSGVLRRKREVQYKASFRRDQQPTQRDTSDVTASRREKQLNRHSYTDSIQTDSQEDEDTLTELPVFGSDKGAMRYGSVPTRLDDLRETEVDSAQAKPSHAASTIHLQNSEHMTTSPNFLTLQYVRRSSPSKKISFVGENIGDHNPHRTEVSAASAAQRGGAFISYAKDLEQLEKQEAEIRKKLKELDAPSPKRSASVLQLGKAKDEYAQAIALGMPILPSMLKQRSLGELSANSGAPPIMPKPILRNSGRRKELRQDATPSVPDNSPNFTEDRTTGSNPPESPPPPPLPPKPAALPPAPPCPPTPTLTPPSPSITFQSTIPNATTPSSSKSSSVLLWQTSDYWGLNGTKTSSVRTDDASNWARDEIKKVGEIFKSSGCACHLNTRVVWSVSIRN